jgi:pyrimidine-nucleoside phosphorylase
MKYLVAELIQKKRDGSALNSEELAFLVSGFSKGSIPDYQISAWLMATFFKGMNSDETFTLTQEMKNSGTTLNWKKLNPSFSGHHFADKHSTGGVGDKVSLILAPVAACLDLKIPMMSGPGLGFTGGTVDKLKSISGFQMQFPQEKMLELIEDVGICMMSQSEVMCPADRKLYGLRDVTATVESLPLITASIVSKKWAAGVENIVYDIKCGSAAFMTDFKKAHELAISLVAVSKLAGMKASALVTRMDEPLGAFVGNALEVKEATFILKNRFPESWNERLAAPLTKLTCRLAAEMAVLAGSFKDVTTAFEAAQICIKDGRAWKVFQRMVLAQGADPDWEKKLPVAELIIPFRAHRSGYLRSVYSRYLGFAGIKISAGREKSSDLIDSSTGFELLVEVGQKITKDQVLCFCHLKHESQFAEIQKNLISTFEIVDVEVPTPQELVLEKMT